MMLLRWLLIFGVLLLSACEVGGSYTSAQINTVKVTKDKEGTIEATNLSPSDKELYVRASVSKIPSNGITLRFRVFGKGVEETPNEILLREFTIDVPSDDDFATLTLTPPSGGWPRGKYRIEIDRLISVEGKTITAFTVSE